MRSAEPKQASSFFFKGTEANAKMASYSLGPYFVVTYCSSIPHDQHGISMNAKFTTDTTLASKMIEIDDIFTFNVGHSRWISYLRSGSLGPIPDRPGTG